MNNGVDAGCVDSVLRVGEGWRRDSGYEGGERRHHAQGGAS